MELAKQRPTMTNEVQNTDLRERFLRVYANLPLNTRQEIIVVLEERPISWDAAYFEVKNNTEKGKEILQKLDKLKLI